VTRNVCSSPAGTSAQVERNPQPTSPADLRAQVVQAIQVAESAERSELTEALDGLARLAARLEAVAFARGHRDVDQAIGDALAALAAATAHVRSAVRAYGGAS